MTKFEGSISANVSVIAFCTEFVNFTIICLLFWSLSVFINMGFPLESVFWIKVLCSFQFLTFKWSVLSYRIIFHANVELVLCRNKELQKRARKWSWRPKSVYLSWVEPTYPTYSVLGTPPTNQWCRPISTLLNRFSMWGRINSEMFYGKMISVFIIAYLKYKVVFFL